MVERGPATKPLELTPNPLLGVGDLGAVLAPFTGLFEGVACTIEHLGAIESVGGVAGNAGPDGDVVELLAETAADTFDRPDRAVLRGVFEKNRVPAIVQSAQGVGVAQGFANDVGGDRCVDRRRLESPVASWTASRSTSARVAEGDAAPQQRGLRV